jgi:hypothetical protein
MKTVIHLISIALFAGVTPSLGQSIVNTEKMMPTLGNPRVLNVELGGNLSGGNVAVSQMKAGINAGLIKGKSTFRLMGGTGVLISQGEVVKNSAFGQLRHNVELSNGIKTFAFYQLQSNNVLLLLRRQLAGGGIRLDLVKAKNDTSKNNPFLLSLMVGAMYEEELLDHEKIDAGVDNHTEFLRLTNSLGFTFQLSPTLKLVSTTYYQPYVEKLSDFRMLTDADLMIKVSDHISLTINGEYRYDSQPPAPLEATDYNLSVGLDISF